MSNKIKYYWFGLCYIPGVGWGVTEKNDDGDIMGCRKRGHTYFDGIIKYFDDLEAGLTDYPNSGEAAMALSKDYFDWLSSTTGNCIGTNEQAQAYLQDNESVKKYLSDFVVANTSEKDIPWEGASNSCYQDPSLQIAQ